MSNPSATAPLVLHHNPFSSNARRVVMTALHLGLPVELHLVRNMHEPVERAALIALNPNAKIPVLVHGDFVLWESTAIMQYLADLTPGQTLYPSELKARADVNRWLAWSGQHWAPPVGVLTWERWMKKLFGFGTTDAAEVARGERDFANVVSVLNQHLATRDWLAGSGLTLADFAAATPLMRKKEASISLDAHPHVATWLARVEALDAWKKTAPP